MHGVARSRRGATNWMRRFDLSCPHITELISIPQVARSLVNVLRANSCKSEDPSSPGSRLLLSTRFERGIADGLSLSRDAALEPLIGALGRSAFRASKRAAPGSRNLQPSTRVALYGALCGMAFTANFLLLSSKTTFTDCSARVTSGDITLSWQQVGWKLV